MKAFLLRLLFFFAIFSADYVHAFTGVEALALFQTASSTASLATDTIKILEIAEESRERFEKAHFTVERNVYRARRLKRNVDYLASLSKYDGESWRDANIHLSDIKNTARNTKDESSELIGGIRLLDKYIADDKEKVTDIELDQNEVMRQEVASSSTTNSGLATQSVAGNTAFSNNILNKMRLDNQRYYVLKAEYLNMQERKRLRDRVSGLDWLGRNADGTIK